MAMKLSFDVIGNVESPTFVLARRNGIKIGKLSNLSAVRAKGDMSKPEISFVVHKYSGTEVTPYWDQIKDFKLVWCKEWDTWFEMKINSNYSNDVSKSVTLTILGLAELSETKIYGMEINTEDDILRDDYVQPTLFYNEDKPEASLMHRLLDKTPHYSVKHIDEHLKGIQRVFSFNDRKLSECFDDIANELDVLFVYDSDSNSEGKPNRTISIYDLKSYCSDCGARGNFVSKCLNCGNTNVTHGYGEDTTILVSKDGLGEEITVTVNQDEVKNCFRLEAGDELMTATIRNCNPNGTNYIWEPGTNIDDMDDELKEQLWKYNEDFTYYRDEYVNNTSAIPVSSYNSIVKKYAGTAEHINPTAISANLVGYSPIMQHYYDAIDLEVYLQSGLLPSLALQDTTAADEAAKLTATKLSPVAVVDAEYMTLSNVSNAVLNAAKIAADPRYQIVVKNARLDGNTWTGNFTVTNFSAAKDTCDSDFITVTANEDYETFVKQKLRKTLYNGTKGKYGSISQMIDMSDDEFKTQLNKYNLVALNSFVTCFTECMKLLSDHGIDKEDAELYPVIYEPINSKIGYVQSEIVQRESEIAVTQTVQKELLKLKQNINDKLDLEKYLGDLWLDFCAYRREETYSNSNYISDYLTNKQLFDLANSFFDLADYELHKVATYTHEITSTLKNLLVMPEFEPILDYFECGNWIRIQDDDGEIYKLRMLDYEIDFDNLETLSVTFSEASRTIDGLAPVREILLKSSNIINNYNAAMNKTNSNFESINDSMEDVIGDSNFNNGYISDSNNDVKEDLELTEKEIYATIDTNDDSIRLYVGDVERTLYSEIEMTATQIRSEVKDADEGLLSRITQTADEIKAIVVDQDERLSTQITQNADKIKVEVKDRQDADAKLDTKITVTAEAIKSEVSATYETKEIVREKVEGAVADANGYTDTQLVQYSTTEQMNSAIEQTASNINLSVDNKIKTTTKYVDDSLKNYSTTTQMNAAIDLKANQITQTVSETYYTKSEAGTTVQSLQSQITQNAGSITSEVTNRTNADNALSSRIQQTATGISMKVNNGDTSSGIVISLTKENGESEEATGTIEMTGLVKFTDLSGTGTTEINGANITTGKISADRIDTNGLVVGWSNLPSSVASTNEIPTSLSELYNDTGYTTMSAVELKGYQTENGVTTIVNGTVTTGYIQALGLEVGTHIAMGDNAKISWGNVTDQPTILNSTDVTTITENTISTTSITAQNLTVKAANISGTLSANKISGGTIDASNVTITNLDASKITSGTIDVSCINVGEVFSKGMSEVGHLTFQHIDGTSGSFSGGVNIGGCSINSPSWTTITIDGVSYTVLTQ